VHTPFSFWFLFFSAGTALVTIFTLRIFHKDEKLPVPNWLSNLVGYLNCRVCDQDEFEDPEYPALEPQKRGKMDTGSLATEDSEDSIIWT
jgi:hypothetical protein